MRTQTYGTEAAGWAAPDKRPSNAGPWANNAFSVRVIIVNGLSLAFQSVSSECRDGVIPRAQASVGGRA